MDIRLLNDARLFSDLAAERLSADPFSTNVIGVQVAGVLDGSCHQGPDDVWIVLIDHGRVTGVAMHTPPHHLFLSRMPARGASRLAAALIEADHSVPGVTGERAAAQAFADTWSAGTGHASSVQTAMRMYRLGELRIPTAVSGTAGRAGPDDADLVTRWCGEFHAEATPDEPSGHLAVAAERRLAAGQIWLWCDGPRSVSMAARSAPANRVARVGPVYTPPRQRRHGYGAAVTAASSQDARAAGAAHVVLYTDLANPISNAIYQSIGYISDHDAQARRFHNPIRCP
jgi:predicted GNAT family acetyltransferase